MSRSTNTNKPSNPAQHFLRWKQAKKTFEYWDKDAQKAVDVPLSTPFIVLDILATVSGFNERKTTGIWSNEVRDSKHILEVRDKDGLVERGPWRTIKEKLAYAKYTASVYAYAKINDEPKLVNLQLSGCALGPWIDFCSSLGRDEIYGDLVVAATGTKEGKKGAVVFNSPVFEVVSRKVSDETRELAKEMDAALQAYLESYLEDSPQARAAKQHSEDMQAFEAPEPSPEPAKDHPDEEDFPF